MCIWAVLCGTGTVMAHFHWTTPVAFATKLPVLACRMWQYWFWCWVFKSECGSDYPIWDSSADHLTVAWSRLVRKAPIQKRRDIPWDGSGPPFCHPASGVLGSRMRRDRVICFYDMPQKVWWSNKSKWIFSVCICLTLNHTEMYLYTLYLLNNLNLVHTWYHVVCFIIIIKYYSESLTLIGIGRLNN